jgi:FimV-like protein
MFKRSVLVILFSALGCAAVSAQDFRVTGTLVSSNGRLAFVNGEMVREGDRVDGGEIISIDAGLVRIRTGSRDLTVRLGSTGIERQSYAAVTEAKSDERPGRANLANADEQFGPTSTANADQASGPAATLNSHLIHGAITSHDAPYGPVNRGEILSVIAQHYRSEGVSTNQMMIALFESNPEAFGGNINDLHEGSVLRIPDADALHRQHHETATAEVARQTDAWRERLNRFDEFAVSGPALHEVRSRPPPAG